VTPSAGDKDAELAALHKENAELRRGQRDSEASGEFLRGGARPPTQEIVDFIDANREEFGVEPICTVLRSAGVSVAPSTFYAAKTRPLSARVQRDAILGPALIQLWTDNYGVYGAHKLCKTARRAGHDVGRDQVARLMRPPASKGFAAANGSAPPNPTLAPGGIPIWSSATSPRLPPISCGLPT
jgi:hypothetical protein